MNKKWKGIIIGTVCGLAIGWASKTLVEKKNFSSEEVLHKVKKELVNSGKTRKIIGSWIVCTPEKFVKDMLTYKVFRGGVTMLTDNEQTTYEFIADAKTGTILDLF
ncbi:PepSY domain-containing protein [Bacillus kwashiorkori]|uniref:PepSY domain-containing protein n=1 Tax=Bacillus kwashiorkori TaxID=1522318 RepID=UPI000782DDAB|nr:PepSY domain-containing protein [Bacillus kwashiorkori]